MEEIKYIVLNNICGNTVVEEVDATFSEILESLNRDPIVDVYECRKVPKEKVALWASWVNNTENTVG